MNTPHVTEACAKQLRPTGRHTAAWLLRGVLLLTCTLFLGVTECSSGNVVMVPDHDRNTYRAGHPVYIHVGGNGAHTAVFSDEAGNAITGFREDDDTFYFTPPEAGIYRVRGSAGSRTVYSQIKIVSNGCIPLVYNGFDQEEQIDIVVIGSNFGPSAGAELVNAASNALDEMKRHPALNPEDIYDLNMLVLLEDNGSLCSFSSSNSRALSCNPYTARSIAENCLPEPDQVVVLHNSPQYGGIANIAQGVATASLHESSAKIVVHELGHSLFKLGDEYPTGSHGGFPNCSVTSECEKWDDLIGFNGVGCEPGCSGGAFFVSEDSVMRSLNLDFEEVNEQIACCEYRRLTNAFPTFCNKFPGMLTMCDGLQPRAAPPEGDVCGGPPI